MYHVMNQQKSSWYKAVKNGIAEAEEEYCKQARRAGDDSGACLITCVLFEDNYVVAGVGESRMALVVDELIGQQDIVIKSLGRRLRNLPGIAGATELGNQKTILVIDMVGLINEITSQNEERASVAR